MKNNYCVKNDVANGQSKSYYFETIKEAVEFAQNKSRKDKRNVIVMDCEELNGIKTSRKRLYLIRYYNGGISREKVNA